MLRTHAVDQAQPAWFIVRVQDIDHPQQLIGGDGWPHLHRHRVADAAEIFDMRPVQRGGTHTDPREMGGQIEPAICTRHPPRLRFFVRQQQRFVRGVKIHPAQALHLAPCQCFHEAHGITDAGHHVLVLGGMRRLAHPAQAPIFGVMQVGEAAINQRTHEVHRHRRARMRLDHTARIRHPRLRGEVRTIDDIAAITGQGDAVAGLTIGRTRLGVLTGKPAHPHHRHLQPMHQHQTHLQQHLEPVGDHFRIAFGKRFRAIAALQQKALAFLRLGQLLFKRKDFA